MSKLMQEAHLVDLSDEQLVQLIGALWESIKTIEERMKSDTEIEDLQTRLKELKDVKYLDEQKRYKAKLRAARVLAKAKNLTITVPEDF